MSKNDKTGDDPGKPIRRRQVLRLAGATTALSVTGAAAWLMTGPGPARLHIPRALPLVDALVGENIESTGVWRPYRIFSHVAQSIEMSMSGYPVPKPAWFQKTLGATAYAVFERRGQMQHALDQPIPGAPEIEVDGDVHLALVRLRTALTEFDAFAGQLQPHFAYGDLTKDQYAAAHVMHLHNHLREIRAT